ncbi:hypothetical protein [Falsiroseomonas sp. HW251]|uniref:hypothetical protein n=1 Tax=Falsiroseomonas sp. HW251 TaxID=3390998 RepID=UPI003D31745C
MTDLAVRFGTMNRVHAAPRLKFPRISSNRLVALISTSAVSRKALSVVIAVPA